MGFNKIELEPIYPRFTRIELDLLPVPKKEPGIPGVARVGAAGLGFVAGVITITPEAVDALDAYLASKQSGLVRFINPVTTPTAYAQAEEETQEGKVVAGALAEAPALSPEALAVKFTQDVDIYKLKIAQALGSPAPEQYSIIFPDKENNEDNLMAFDSILFKQDPEGNVTVAHALTRLDNIRPVKGISDQDLVEGKSGGYIIPFLAEGVLPVSQSALDTVTKLAEAVNLPLLKVTGATPDGIYRLGDEAGDYFTLIRDNQTDQYRLGNIAIPLTNVDLIPETAIIPKPETATGGGTTPIPEETAQLPSELFETTPQGRLATEKFPEGEVGWKPRKESATSTDGFFNTLNIKVIFKSNPNLRSGIGTYDLKPCPDCRKTPERYAILKGSVDPADPRTLIMESNFFRRDYKLDPAWREQLADLTAGAIGHGLSQIIFGMSTLELDEKGTQEQRNYIGQLSVKLQYEIRPLELIAPTTA